MNEQDDASQTVQLTASEVALATQFMASDLEEANAFEPIKTAPEINSSKVAHLSIASYSMAALVFYALISFVQTVLDVEHVDGNFQTQFVHYVLTDVWLNISGALLLAAWMMVDRRQSHLAGNLSSP